MEVINRKSVSIINGTLRSRQRHYVKVNNSQLYFTAAVVRDLGIKEGDYVQFMNEGDKWQFFIDDNEDGFKLTPCRTKGGFDITSSALCKLIQKTTGYTTVKQYQVIKTGAENDRCPIYELKGF
jgi:hypothetical protein